MAISIVSYNGNVTSTYNPSTKLVYFSGEMDVIYVQPSGVQACGGDGADFSTRLVFGLDNSLFNVGDCSFPQMIDIQTIHFHGSEHNIKTISGTLSPYTYNTLKQTGGYTLKARANAYHTGDPTNTNVWSNNVEGATGINVCFCGISNLDQPTWSIGSEPPLAPSTPTFSINNIFNGYDSIRICVSGASTYIDYWSIQRSTTSGGTYTEIAKIYSSGSTRCYTDETVVTGNTYWYKVIASNELYDTSSAIQSITCQSVVDSSCVIRNLATITNVNSGDTQSIYELWRCATQNGTYERVGHQHASANTVSDYITDYGVTYWYKIKQIALNWTLWSTATQYTGTLSMPSAPVLSGVLNSGSTTVDFSWTDTNTWKQEYEIWRQIGSGGTFSLLTTVTGTSYTADVDVNVFYKYKIRGVVDCFAPTYVYSPYSNELEYSIYPILYAPTNLTLSSITCTGGTLTWTNNNVSGQTGNYVLQYNGSGYTTIATLSSGATSYSFTGLTPNTAYNFSVAAYNGGRTAKSSGVILTTLNPQPYNLNDVVNYDQCAFTWNLNDLAFGTSIVPEYRYSGTTNWTSGTTLAKNATGYTFTNLLWGRDYEARIVRYNGSIAYPSIVMGFSTSAYLAPTDLTTPLIFDKTIYLNWTNNSTNDNISIYYKKENEAWQLYEVVDNMVNSHAVTGLSMNTLYTFVVANNYGAFQLFSNQIQATTTTTFLPAFCSNASWYLTNTTCGNSTGRIEVEEDYTIFYNFSLVDSFGNSHAITNYYWTGLTAGWYCITATVRPEWYFHYGNDGCVADWIPIYDSNTTINVGLKIKNAICGGFGSNKGRVIFQVTNSGVTTGFTFSLWNADRVLVNQQTFTGSTTGITNVQYNSPADTYYGIVEDSNGCTYLIQPFKVEPERLFTNTGIQRLFLTPFSPYTSYNYYSSSNEDWYVAGIDQQSYTSSKIMEFVGLQDFWYEIRLDTARMNYRESFEKGSNGLTYSETVEIQIPRQDNAKWKELVNILTDRYTLVFQDSNGFWWCCGYRQGMEVKAYVLSENSYSLTFTYPSSTKMLCAIDYNYVKNSIL